MPFLFANFLVGISIPENTIFFILFMSKKLEEINLFKEGNYLFSVFPKHEVEVLKIDKKLFGYKNIVIIIVWKHGRSCAGAIGPVGSELRLAKALIIT